MAWVDHQVPILGTLEERSSMYKSTQASIRTMSSIDIYEWFRVSGAQNSLDNKRR